MKARAMIVITLLIVSASSLYLPAPAVAALPLLGHQIAIDPGHGGMDPGAHRDGLSEDEVVLALALDLKAMLVAAGASVHLTRETDTDLADQDLGHQYTTRKKQDIARRVALVNAWQPDLLISLHVNAIGSSRWRGAQVFFPGGKQESEQLAKTIQQALTRVLQNTDRQAKVGDYRILNDAKPAAVLVEVGFISNPEEAALLSSAEYRQKVAWAIMLGLEDWWNRVEARDPGNHNN